MNAPDSRPLPFIVGISGPPRAGKDTFCGFLHSELFKLKVTATAYRMSAPLKLLAAEMIYEKKYATEGLKDVPFNSSGTTYRTLQIALFSLGSQLLGPDWLGQHFIRAVYNLRYSDFVLMPDCGRPEDVQPILSMELPFHHVIIQRDGTTYEGDSRVPFSFEDTLIIPNNGTLDELRQEAAALARDLVSHRSKVLEAAS